MTITHNEAADRQLTPRAPTRVGQATAVEQSRAVAEVEAAIVVAMRHPRDVPGAIAEMRESCKRRELADRAFFAYPKGGKSVTGPSIHLARELARIWGNIQWGLRELRRDDEYGQSEILAFAWDVQTNARNDNVFINPHKLYTGNRELTDLRDIYENNANVGARRVRSAIFGVLPTWFVDEATELCSKTLADGGGVPRPQRIANAIEVFGNLGVAVAQLEAKIGSPSGQWTDYDVAQLRIIRQSLLRGEITRDEAFPAAQAGADELTGKPAAAAQRRAKAKPDEVADKQPPENGAATTETDGRCPPALASEVNAHFTRLGFTVKDREQVNATAAKLAGREGEVGKVADLTEAEALKVRAELERCGTRDDLVALLATGDLPATARQEGDGSE